MSEWLKDTLDKARQERRASLEVAYRRAGSHVAELIAGRMLEGQTTLNLYLVTRSTGTYLCMVGEGTWDQSSTSVNPDVLEPLWRSLRANGVSVKQVQPMVFMGLFRGTPYWALEWTMPVVGPVSVTINAGSATSQGLTTPKSAR